MDRVDAELIESLRAGDERAMAELLSRHTPGIYRFGLKMCRDAEDAKDVVQDTLLAAARGIREFRGTSSLSTWLYTVARRFCIRKRRGSKRLDTNSMAPDEERLAKETASHDVAPDEAAADRELGAALQRAIAALDPMYREVLVLRDVEGLSAPEVAEVVGITVDAVKSRLHRARVEVRTQLEPFSPRRSVRRARLRRAGVRTSSHCSRATSKTRLVRSNAHRWSVISRAANVVTPRASP